MAMLGLLYYRGYPIEQLAENSDFLEVCYLLLNGELPNAEQKAEFSAKSSRITPWCMTSLRVSSTDSVAMRIRWR